MSSALEKVKILVLGDSGVGKTSLIHLIVHHEVLKNSSWTIGCSVDVKLHEFKDGTVHHKSYFIEFFDIGGNNAHKASAKMFYSGVDGIILVHDLTNIKSQENLKYWLTDVIEENENMTIASSDSFSNDTRFNANLHLNNSQTKAYASFDYLDLPPILVVGTKLDQAQQIRNLRNVSPIAVQFRSDEINLDCSQPKYLASATSNSIKLAKFFDKVIETKMKHSPRESIKDKSISYSTQSEKQKNSNILTNNINNYNASFNIHLGNPNNNENNPLLTDKYK